MGTDESTAGSHADSWVACIPATPVLLVETRATVLDQNHRYDDKQHSGDNTNNRYGIHNSSPSFQRDAWCDVPGLQDFNSGLRISCASTAPEEPRNST
jgi:hypothetical protein